jgi:mRNA interferase RelE/StbE
LRKLDKNNTIRILKKMEELKENPKIGIPLVGNLAGLWKLRTKDFRVIYQLRNEELVVIVVNVGNQKNIY